MMFSKAHWRKIKFTIQLIGCKNTQYLSLLLALMIPIESALADAPVFDNREVDYVVGSKPGGGYDRYTRLITPFLQEYLQGSDIKVENRPAGAGIPALNAMYANVPDGREIMTFNTGHLLAQIVGGENINFDVSELGWIGKASSEARILIVRSDLGIRNFEDLIIDGVPTILATSNFGAANYIQISLLREVFGLNVRILPGFGGSEARASLLKGEIGGILTSESNIEKFDIDDITPLLVLGNSTNPILASVPHGMHVATNSDQNLVVKNIALMSNLGRLTATTPGTPDYILDALRGAYQQALTSPELLYKAIEQGLVIDFADGETVEKMVLEFMNANDRFAEIVKRVLSD